MIKSRDGIRVLLTLLFLLFTTACTADDKDVSEGVMPPEPSVVGSSEPVGRQFDDLTGQDELVFSFTSYDCLPQENGQYTRFNQVFIKDIGYHIDREEYTEEECAEIINYIELEISRLKDDYGFTTKEGLCIYVSSKVVTQGTYANICINSSDIYTLDGLIAVMTGFFGELSNYGLCYGLVLYMDNEEMQEFNMADRRHCSIHEYLLQR